MSDTNTLDAPEQLTSAATTLQSVQTRLEQAAAQRRQDILAGSGSRDARRSPKTSPTASSWSHQS
jgi:hypothetical protein